MAKKNKPPSIFALALAARQGDIPPESLSGAAKRLYKDTTLTHAQLKDYANPSKIDVAKLSIGRTQPTFKRG